MKKKLITFLFSTLFLCVGIYFSGVYVTSAYVEEGINNALNEFNEGLYKKYNQGLIPYEYKFHYETYDQGLLSSKGTLHCYDMTNSGKTDLPVEIWNRFLVAKAKIDTRVLVKELVDIGVLNLKPDFRTDTRLKFRFWPRNFEINAYLNGKYKDHFIASDLSHLAKFAKKELNVHFSLNKQSEDKIETSFDASNIASNYFTALRIYSLSKSYLDKKAPHSNMVLGAEGLFAFSPMLSNINSFKFKFDTTVPDAKDKFNLKYNADIQSNNGQLQTRGFIGPFSYATFSGAKGLEVLSLNNIFSEGDLTLGLDDLYINYFYSNISNKYRFKANAKGSMVLPCREDLFSVLFGAQGKFKIKLNDVSDSIVPYLPNFKRTGQGAYKADIEIKNGRIQVNGLELY